MKILHLYKAYRPVLGGIEGHVELLAEAQAGVGHDVTVLTTGSTASRADALENGVRVVRVRSLAELASNPIAPGLGWALHQLDYELLHLQSPFPSGSLAALLSPTARRVPWVVSYQSDIVRQRWLGALWAPIRYRFLRRCAAILVASPPYLETSPVLARHRDRCHIVPLGVDAQRFRPRPRKEGDPWGAETGPLVLFVGRLRYYKGLEVLVDAMAGVNATLLIAGRGEREDALRRQADASPAGDRIRFLGDVDAEHLPLLYSRADIVVLPSTMRTEAYGLSLVEAMACGTPVISTELGTGTSWINVDGQTGRVVEAGNSEALGRTLRELLDDEDRRAALGRGARRRVEENLTSETMVETILGLYHGLVGPA